MLVVSSPKGAAPSVVNTPSKDRLSDDAVPSDANPEPTSSVQELEFESLLQLVAKTTELLIEPLDPVSSSLLTETCLDMVFYS
eukprot:15353916-Ditylum_brightwellii.AAC.1